MALNKNGKPALKMYQRQRFPNFKSNLLPFSNLSVLPFFIFTFYLYARFVATSLYRYIDLPATVFED